MLNYYHLAEVKNGKLIFDNEHMFNLDLHNKENKRVRVLIEEDRPKASVKSKNYYFAILRNEATQMNEFAGLTVDEIHTILYRRIYGSQLGETQAIEQFNQMNDRNFKAYLDSTIDFLTNLGARIKPPATYQRLTRWSGKK